MHGDDRLQGILFNASDTIRFADASSVSKRMIIKTKRVANKVSRFKETYHLPLPEVTFRAHPTKRLRSRETADIVTRFKIQ